MKIYFAKSIVPLTIAVTSAFPVTLLAEEAKQQISQADTSGPIFFVGQKFWGATWDVPMIDAQVVLPGPSLKTSHQSSMSGTEFIPVTTVGMQYKGVSLVANYFANTTFTPSADTSTKASRTEWDVALGYAILPNLTASVAYKSGKVDEVVTSNARAITGASTGYKVEGWLIGLSGSAPLQGPLSLYGNMAYGLAKETVDGGTFLGSPSFDGNYKIGEIGLSYRLLGAENSSFFKSLVAQLGYRAQVITLKGINFPTYSLPPGAAPISSQKYDIKSTTDGLVIGLVAAF